VDFWELLPHMLMLAAGLLFAIIGRRAARGELKPNQLVGVRTARTLASEEEWYRVHARAALPWTFAGAALVVLNAAVLLAATAGRLSRPASGLAFAASIVVLLTAAVLPLWSEREEARPRDSEADRLERGTLAAVLGFLAFILLVLGAGSGYLLGTGAIDPNAAVGVRVPETLASPEAWHRVNRPAGWAFLASSLVGGLACLWGAFALPRARYPGRVLAVALAITLLAFAVLAVYTSVLLGSL